MHFRFVSKLMTLDELERPKRTLAEKSFYRAHHKNLNEDRPILPAAKCRSMILVSRDKRLCEYSQAFPTDRGIEWQFGS